MEATKFATALFYFFLGWPASFLVIIENYDNWKGSVLFFLAMIFLVSRIFILWRREHQRYKEKEMELEQKELEIQKQKNKTEDE